MNLTTAVQFAEGTPDLDSSNYTLVTAEFDPGVLINGTVWVPATWSLWFAQTYDGFWLYGPGTDGASSAYVAIDASSGAVVKAFDFPTWQPILSANYSLNVTAAEAIQTVRDMGAFQNPSPNQTFSSALTQSGNVTSISPRIIKFDPTAGIPLQDPINSSLSAQSRLCWLISLTYSMADYGGGAQGTFAVDAETGDLDSGWEQGTFPDGGFGGVKSFIDHLIRPEHHRLPRNLPDERERCRASQLCPGHSPRRISRQTRLDGIGPSKLLVDHWQLCECECPILQSFTRAPNSLAGRTSSWHFCNVQQ